MLGPCRPCLVRNGPKGSSALVSKTLLGSATVPRTKGAPAMKNPLDSLWGTIICGFILTAILWAIARVIVSHAIGAGS